jgi:hypothetical protein
LGPDVVNAAIASRRGASAQRNEVASVGEMRPVCWKPFGARTIAEESDAAHWPYAASHGTPLASGHATVCVGNSGFALANRPGPLVLLSGIISETVKGDRLLFFVSSPHLT